MSERRIFIDESIGETRGVVTLDGRPERLIIRRHDDEPRLQLGARVLARVAQLEPALSMAFLDLGGGLQAVLTYRADDKPVRGQSMAVEIRSEPRNGKLAVAKSVSEESQEGAPRLLDRAPDLADTLRIFGRDSQIAKGVAARDAADEAEQAALEIVHPLPGGGTIAIETTRALTTVDVDTGERKGGDTKRAARQANLAALREAARILRLKGLGGLVVFDLVGRGHDANALLTAARSAFGPDNPGVAIGAISRFGLLELSTPRRGRPVLEILTGVDGQPTDRSVAQRVIRRLQAEGASNPGDRLFAACHPAVAAEAAPLVDMLAAKLGPRFSITKDPARLRDSFVVSTA